MKKLSFWYRTWRRRLFPDLRIEYSGPDGEHSEFVLAAGDTLKLQDADGAILQIMVHERRHINLFFLRKGLEGK